MFSDVLSLLLRIKVVHLYHLNFFTSIYQTIKAIKQGVSVRKTPCFVCDLLSLNDYEITVLPNFNSVPFRVQ